MKKLNIILSILLYLSFTNNLFADDNFRKTKYENLNAWQKDDHSLAFKSFLNSCDALLKKDKEKIFFKISEYVFYYKNIQKICDKAKNIKNISAISSRLFFEKNFAPYAIYNENSNEGLFTGYYEISLDGCYKKTSECIYPIYKLPKDLSYSRKQINEGVLANKNLELLWVKDPVRLFLLHVQGSGIVNLPDGANVKVGYAGKNKHQYKSIGKYMIDKSYIESENISAISISDWLYNNKEQIFSVLEQNPSYIFFRILTNSSPIGAQGVELTANRSLAIDDDIYPFGLPIWLDLKFTDTPNYKDNYFKKLLISQDTGSAIKGYIRGDIFLGSSDKAQEIASYQKSKGKYYILLPKYSALDKIMSWLF